MTGHVHKKFAEEKLRMDGSLDLEIKFKTMLRFIN